MSLCFKVHCFKPALRESIHTDVTFDETSL